jgi:hypothetical protein
MMPAIVGLWALLPDPVDHILWFLHRLNFPHAPRKFVDNLNTIFFIVNRLVFGNYILLRSLFIDDVAFQLHPVEWSFSAFGVLVFLHEPVCDQGPFVQESAWSGCGCIANDPAPCDCVFVEARVSSYVVCCVFRWSSCICFVCSKCCELNKVCAWVRVCLSRFGLPVCSGWCCLVPTSNSCMRGCGHCR